jgi:transcriptional regulator with XRE-family HTH domain
MDKLIEFRKGINMTPKEMASTMGISQSYYYKVESGLREPSYNFMKKFKKAFGTAASIDKIFF